MAIKTSVIADLQAFVKNIPATTPYEQLLGIAADAGWTYRLIEKGYTVAPDSSVLITFTVHVGNDPAALERLDDVTFRLPPGPGAVSLIARVQMEQSLVYLFFGRLPPPATVAVPQPAPGQMNGGDAPNAHNAFAGPVDGGEYVPNDDDAPARPDVVDRREPDGLPIFVDLYAMDGPLKGTQTGDVIDALLEEVKDFLQMASSVEQVNALALKNETLRQFIKDFGDDQDNEALSSMVRARLRELTVPAAAAAAANAPRRRVRPQAN